MTEPSNSSNSSANLSSYSDAAAVLLAAVGGDHEAAHTVVQQIARGDNARVELAEALHWTIVAASGAIKRELDAAVERGDEECAAVNYLVAASQHAHRSGE